MPRERSNIKFPFWRKAVDDSMWRYNSTVIPKGIVENHFDFSQVTKTSSKEDEESFVKISFNGKEYMGNLLWTGNKTRSQHWKLRFPKELTVALRECFVMTHMRDLDNRILNKNMENQDEKESKKEAEDRIPFSEFIDIEWDWVTRHFSMKPYFKQRAEFENLFQYFQRNHILTNIERNISEKQNQIIHGEWKDRSSIVNDGLIHNAIYTLVDTINEEIYIGETHNMGTRFPQDGYRPEIPNWDKYRIDVLPAFMGKGDRKMIERQMIRNFASLCKHNSSNKDIDSLNILNYKLKNKSIP